MFKSFVKLSLIAFLSSNLYANNINVVYSLSMQPQKNNEVQKALSLKQYLNDLEQLNIILNALYHNKSFKSASESAELAVKNSQSYYSYDFIENLLKILNGVDDRDDSIILHNSGYIAYIKNIYKNDYEMYLNNIPVNSLLNNNLKYLVKDINKNLKLLNNDLKNEKNIRPLLKQIFHDLIVALNNVNNETLQLKKMKILKVFTKYVDKKYHMPPNWAQTDGKTTLSDIVNFMLNGYKKGSYYGIKFYFDRLYLNNDRPLVIGY